MYNTFKRSFTALMLLVVLAAINSSCKKKFDEPPVYVAPTITANCTIKDLKARLTASGAIVPINEDLIIRGIVVGDDKSGNLYKTIVIQDETAGLAILLDATNLFTSYPVGREIFIKCNGLYLGDYNRLIQLGGGIDNSGTTPSVANIPSSLFGKYIVKGSFNNVVTPRVVTVSQLTTNLQDTLQNTLIQLNNFEFAVADTGKTYALPNQNPPGTVNFTIKDCSSNSITLRNSGYSNFAGFNVPNGNGSIVALYTVFGTTKQLTIRDTMDLKFTGARCGSGGGGGGGGGTNTGTGNIFSETFEAQTVSSTNPLTMTGWQNMAEAGGVKYYVRSFGTPVNKYAQVSAFSSNQATVTSWLVTPGINLGSFATKWFNFETLAGYTNGATLKVLVSTNYTGTGNPWAATWTDLTAQAAFSPGLTNGYAASFTQSGNISLNSYSGTIYIAFKYEGADPSGTASDKTTTWEVDNVKVSGQ